MSEKQETFKRRLPAIERSISEIQAEKDIRVKILGTVIDMSDAALLVDDGTGKAEVMFDGPEELMELTQGQLVKVIVRVLPLVDGYTLRGECVQNMKGFDINLYKRSCSIGT